MPIVTNETPILEWINKESNGAERRARWALQRLLSNALKEANVHEAYSEAVSIRFSEAIAEYVVEAVAGSVFRRETGK